MKKCIYSCLILFSLVFSSLSFANDSADAETFIKNWFEAIKNQQFDQVADSLAPQFVSMHTDGIRRDKAQEMELIKNLKMKSYRLSDFNVSSSGDILIVTYKDTGSELIDKKPISGKSAERMAVLQKQNGKWVIIAYANMTPIK